MKTHILALLVLLNLVVMPKLFSQNVSINSTGNMPDTSAMLDVSSTTKGFLMPRMTTAQQNAIILPATGLSIFNTTVNSFQINIGTPASPIWTSVATAGSAKDTFTANITVTSLNGLGKYSTNAVIPAIGKTAGQVIIDALNQVIGPTYVAPTATISSVPGGGIVEIGSNLNVTLSSVFNQNDGGASTGTIYYIGAAPLAANTSTVTNITAPVTYKVIISYGQGNCKNNNQGVTDCTGRINAGSVTSSNTITFTPTAQRYWGRCSGVPSSATILDATTSGGGSDFVTSKAKTGFTITASGSNNIYFAYPATLGDLTAISVGGFDSFPAFTKNTVSLTNASGYTQNYNVYISNNTLSGDATNIITQ